MPVIPRLNRPLLGLLAALVAVAGIRLSAAPTGLAGPVSIAGQRAALLPPGARVLGPLPARQQLQLIVGLALRDGAGLQRLLVPRADGTRGGGSRLTPAAFAARFGITVGQQAALVAYLRGNGLRVVRTYPDRLLIDVAGAAGDVTRAFGTPLLRYRTRSGSVYYLNTRAPRLPAALVGLVSTVVGLRNDGHWYHRPAALVHSMIARPLPVRPGRRQVARTSNSPGVYGLTPDQLRTAYDVAPLYTQAANANGVPLSGPLTGAGQTIAVFEESPYSQSDTDTYDSAFHLQATTPTVIPVDGGPTGAFGGGGADEVALDVELIQAIAPSAQILVYTGNGLPPPSTDNTGADHIYARIVNDARAQILSTSWGQCEPEQQADTPADTVLLHNLFAQAVAEGMTVLAATGDTGSNDCSSSGQGGGAVLQNPSVDYPASDPNVVAVGGTTLSVKSDGSVASEPAWGGSGGGASSIFQRPSWQQAPGLPAGTARMVPDVAANGGAASAIAVGGNWAGVAGTSAGPPFWAGLLALGNQARRQAAAAWGQAAPVQCGAGLGDPHALFYNLATTPPPTPVFRDIGAGTSNGAYSSGPGWDALTGLGVPDGAALVGALAAPCTAPTVTLTPTSTASPVPSATPTASATATPSATSTASLTATVPPTSSAAPLTFPSLAGAQAGGSSSFAGLSGVAPTSTPSPSPTFVPTRRPTATVTATRRPTATATATRRPTSTMTPTPRPSATASRPRGSNTSSPGAARRATPTATLTPVRQATPTSTRTPVRRAAHSAGVTRARRATPTPTARATRPRRATATPTSTPTVVRRVARTATSTSTPVHKASPTATPRRQPKSHATSTHQKSHTTPAQRSKSHARAAAKSSTRHVKTRAVHAKSKPTLKKKVSRKAPKHIVVPRLLTAVTVHTVHGVPIVRFSIQWEPKVVLHLTVIERKRPRRHVLLRSDAHGRAVYQFPAVAPRQGQRLTVTLRVWGVYAHHRRTSVVKIALFR